MLPLVAGLKSADPGVWTAANNSTQHCLAAAGLQQASEVERGEREAHKARAAYDTGVNKGTSAR